MQPVATEFVQASRSIDHASTAESAEVAARARWLLAAASGAAAFAWAYALFQVCAAVHLLRAALVDEGLLAIPLFSRMGVAATVALTVGTVMRFAVPSPRRAVAWVEAGLALAIALVATADVFCP